MKFQYNSNKAIKAIKNLNRINSELTQMCNKKMKIVRNILKQ